MSNKKKRINVVYSTNPDYNYTQESNQEEEALPPQNQNLKIGLEKKGRAGKAVSIVKGFVGPSEKLNQLAKALKQHCGVGGSVKEDEIIIQGDQRKKIMEFLTKNNYNSKFTGG